MFSKAVAVAVLISIAIAAGGCRGGSEAEAEGPVDITKLRAEYKERFGVPPNVVAPEWYAHTTAINMVNGRLEITTDLTPEEYAASDILREACAQPLGLAFELAEPDTIELTAAVFGVGGVPLGGCA